VIEGFCTGTGDDVVKELDFGLGDAEYKAALCSRGWLEASVYIFAPTLKGIGLKGMRATARAVDGAARKLLVSTNLLPRLKRLWRDRLRRGGQPAAAAPGRQTS
jgi:CelD/BcsL family acetyltransferase involved in cellulose biosynthesis